MPTRPLAGAAAVLFLSVFAPADLKAQDTIQQWRRWEKTFQSGRTYTQNVGNPYRDLIVQVRFTQSETGKTFFQDAFWEGSSTAPRSFKVRTALPPGTWTWQIAGCTGSTGGQSCAGDTWTPSSGTITVQSNTGSGIRIYDRGFLTQLPYMTPTGGRYDPLVYGDSVTPFFWSGDTAWAAPPREISGQTAAWTTFLNDRKSKGYTVVLVAPAPAWKPKAGDTWAALPDALNFSFEQVPGCTTANPVLPNDCSRPRPQYWTAFDSLIQQANDRDLVVVIAGVIDPVDLGDDGTYPNLANARHFARYLAARMAGSFVLFSPGFDDKVTKKTQDGLKTVRDVMNDVGSALRLAAPWHLVTNHLAGAGTCTDYADFRNSSWMTFYMFHSGHALAPNPSAEPCPGWRDTLETRVQAAMRRAREMPMTLRTYTQFTLPSYNGEGPYDKFPITTDPVDNRYRVRHAGHLSSLSDAGGFTYGVLKLALWDQSGTTFSALFGLVSAADMQSLANRFRSRPRLTPQHGWIANQPAAPNHEKMMVLATDSSSLVLAYLPGESTTEIKISTSGLPTLTCSGGWTFKWFDPPLNSLGTNPPNVCQAGTNQITVKKPLNCSNPSCDWVLEIQRTSTALTSSSQVPTDKRVGLWSDSSSGDGTSAVFAEIISSMDTENPIPILISPAGSAFQQSPRVTRQGNGYFVVWQADGLDRSLEGVFAQRLDANGALLGERIQVNSFTEHDQCEPAVASDATGTIMVVWSSYGQDGDLGGIFGQRFDSLGKRIGEEIAINSQTLGHQFAPQVGTDAVGNFVVAWTTEVKAGQELRTIISVRRFDRNGLPLTKERSIESRKGTSFRLMDLQVSPLGDFSILWTARDDLGVAKGLFLQRFDTAGQLLGPEAEVTN